MPLKFDLDHICVTVQLSALVFRKRISESLEGSPGANVIGFSRIPRSLTISEELKNERFVRCERDRDVVEFKHECPTILSVKRPAFLPALLAECKQNVAIMFSFKQVRNAAISLGSVFQICNDKLVNPGLYYKLRFCFESTFFQELCKQFYENPCTRKSKLSPVKSTPIHSRDLDHAYASGVF